MPDGSLENSDSLQTDFLSRLPPHVLGSLTVEQKAAVAAAAEQRDWEGYPVNIRVSLPLPGRRWFFTVVGGPERRAAGRRRLDRKRHPLRTAGNFAFILMAAIGVYAVAAVLMLFSFTILEY